MAFITGPSLPSNTTHRQAKFVCSASPEPKNQAVSRRQLLSGATAAVTAAILSATATPAPANAGLESAFSKILFPKEGFNAPDTLKASSNVVNQAALKSKEAQQALERLRGYNASISELYTKFKSDPQIELSSSVRKMVSISDLRNALNVVNEAIDEDSQFETDKVVRGIIQDIGELENAGYVKKGSTRTPKKIDRTTDWFVKLTGDFTRLLAFYS